MMKGKKNVIYILDQHNQDVYAIFGSAATGRTNLKAKSVESGNCSNILEQLSKEKVPSFNLEVLSF